MLHRSKLLVFGALSASCSSQTTAIQRPGEAHAGSVKGREHGPLVASAALQANDVYKDPAFWALVEQRSWVATYDATSATPGREVRAALQYLRPAELGYEIEHLGAGNIPVIRWRWKDPVASTSSCTPDKQGDVGRCGRVHISIDFLPREPGLLVNTIAHETTHTIGGGTGECGCTGDESARFTDTGMGELPDGLTAWLVSYGIGDLAQCYVQSKANGTDTWRCFDQTLNGDRCNRRIVECCPNDADTTAIVEARNANPRCKAVATMCPKPDAVSCSYGRG